MKYLSPKQLGQAIQVSESSLKRWIDDGQISVTRTAGGHRRIELSEAVRFVRTRGYTITDPSVLGLNAADQRTGRADPNVLCERFHDLLIRGRDKEFVSVVTRLYLDGHGLPDLIDGPLRGAMSQIGELWHNNPDGVGIEHRATDICIRTLGYLHTLIKPAEDDAPLAIGGAPPGDMHLISSLCVSLVLAEQGWREINLGANTPWGQFYSVAERERASLVWVSMTAEAKNDLPTQVINLGEKLSPLPSHLVIGGRQVDEQFNRARASNVHTAQSMVELVAFTRGLMVATKALTNGHANAGHANVQA